MINLNFRQFQSAVKRVSSACSDDTTRPILHLIKVTGTESNIRIESADGFRLHRVNLPTTKSQPFTVLLDPAQIAAILKYKTSRKDDPAITLDIEAGHALIDNKVIAGEFAEERYFDTDALFPRDSGLIVTIDPAELLQAVKNARVFAREASNVVQLHITNKILVIGQSEETGTSCTVVNIIGRNAKRTGEILIGFNADFLIDYLKQTNGVVTISLNKSVTPAIFTDETGFTALVMPMKLENTTIRTESDIRPESDYDSAGAYVYPDEYTRRHPGLPHIAPHEIPVTPRELEPYDHPLTVSDDPCPVEVFTGHAEPGAQEYDITTIWSYLEENNYKKSRDVKVIVFHLTDPRPDPDAPTPAARVPLFSNIHAVTFNKCTRCGDGPTLLRGGLCVACRESDQALAISHPENCN